MKGIKLWLLILCMALIYPEIKAQNFCATRSDVPNVLQGVSQYQIVKNTYTIRIFFHIIRRTNGTGGQTVAEINTALNVLNSDYAAHGINFSLLGIDEILDDNAYNRTNFDYLVNGT